ncbi:MAG TPA: 5'-methylthioadenosine/S-adenosylhomocysteine nucleosidase [Acetobacteraceae bacterium]|nr:5'-methylthioadenosine/S-adenosylhomocysteine nucleosidase [Acetobacteraceae bacterium]
MKVQVPMLAGFLFVALLLSGGRAVEAAGTLDPTPRTAVISAFPPEMVELRAALQGAKEYDVDNVIFTTGTLEGKPALLLLSGISMVNAAMATQLALDHFTVRQIIVSGIAGGVDPALTIGDVVVPAEWGEYLEAVFARQTESGSFQPPSFATHLFANFGMIFPEPEEIAQGNKPPESRFWFAADPGLLALARKVAQTTVLKDCTANGKCLDHKPQILVGGRGVSGQAFVDNKAFRDYVWKTFDAKALDMESAAIAHVATMNGTPFIVFRSLSDLAGGGPGENEIGTFFQLASDNAASVVLSFLKAVPEDQGR